MKTEGNMGSSSEGYEGLKLQEQQLGQWGEEILYKAVDHPKEAYAQIEAAVQRAQEAARETAGGWSREVFLKEIQNQANRTGSVELSRLARKILAQTERPTAALPSSPEAPIANSDATFVTLTVGEVITLVTKDGREQDWILSEKNGDNVILKRRDDDGKEITLEIPSADLEVESDAPDERVPAAINEPPAVIEAVAQEAPRAPRNPAPVDFPSVLQEKPRVLKGTPEHRPERKSSIQLIFEALDGGQEFADQTFRDIIGNSKATEEERVRAKEILTKRDAERNAQREKRVAEKVAQQAASREKPIRTPTLIERMRTEGFGAFPEHILDRVLSDTQGRYSSEDKQQATLALEKLRAPIATPVAVAPEAALEVRPEAISFTAPLATPSRKLVDRVSEAKARGEEIPSHVIELMRKGTNRERAWVEAELAKQQPAATAEINVAVVEPSKKKSPEPITDYEHVDPEVTEAWKTNSGRDRLTFLTPTTAADMIRTRSEVLGARGTKEIQRNEERARLREKRVSSQAEKSEEVPEEVSSEETLHTPTPPRSRERVGHEVSSTQEFSYATAWGREKWDEGKGTPFELSPKELEQLDEVNPLWEPFIEGYVDPRSLAGKEALPTPTAQTKEEKGKELELLGMASIDAHENSSAQAPKEASREPLSLTREQMNEKHGAPMNDFVVKQFQEKFGLEYGELKNSESFSGLSVGRQMLVLQNLEQLTLSEITNEAKEAQRKEWGSTGKWKRFVQSVLALGMKPELRIAEIEKALLAKSQGQNADQEDGAHRKAKTLAYIESLAKVAELGPEVVTSERGALRINYVAPKDIFDSLEDPKLKGEHGGAYMQAIEKFNHTATEFANLPHEWRYAKTDLAGKERTLFEEKEFAYSTARRELLAVYKAKFSEEDMTSAEGKAMLAMNKLDERVTLNQLFNGHPDAETALQSIADESVFRRGFKEFWKAKGLFVAYGAAGRAATVAAAGALAVPTMGASLLGLGVVGAVGGGVGYGIGKEEGRRLMKEYRASGRMSEDDEREEISYQAVKRDETPEHKVVMTAEGKPEMIEKKRLIKEFTAAAFFTDRIERLMDKLENTKDTKERTLLETKIAQTVTLMATKLEHGMINWGERKGASIANRLSFMQAMARGAIAISIDTEHLEEESARLVGLHETTIEEKRKAEIKRIVAMAVKTRAGFALAGAGIAQAAHFLYVNGLPDITKILSRDEALSGAGFIKEVPETGGSVREVISESPSAQAEGLMENRFVSKQIVDYSLQMNKELDRPLSLMETNALWRTTSENVGSPQFQAHGKLMGLLMSKRTPLSEAEISDVFKSVKFDPTTMGKPLPEEVAPGLGRNEEVIYDKNTTGR